MALADILAALRPSLGKVTDRRAEIAREIDKLTAERCKLIAAPLPYADFRAAVLGSIDARAKRGEQLFASQMMAGSNHATKRFREGLPQEYNSDADTFEKVFDNSDPRIVHALLPHMTTTPQMHTLVSEDAFCALLAPVIKETLGRVMDERIRDAWPQGAEVGPPRAERRARIKDINAKIAALEAEAEKIADAIRAAAAEIERSA